MYSINFSGRRVITDQCRDVDLIPFELHSGESQSSFKMIRQIKEDLFYAETLQGIPLLLCALQCVEVILKDFKGVKRVPSFAIHQDEFGIINYEEDNIYIYSSSNYELIKVA